MHKLLQTCQEFDLPANIFQAQRLGEVQLHTFSRFYLSNLIEVYRLHKAVVCRQRGGRKCKESRNLNLENENENENEVSFENLTLNSIFGHISFVHF